MSDLETYLDVLFGGLEGHIYSPVKTDSAFHQHWFDYPSQLNELVTHIENSVGDVYISPAIYTQEIAKKPYVKKIQTVWIDFDGLERVDFKDVEKPTLVVQTSSETKGHFYWRVAPSNQVTIEDTNRRLAYYLGADNGGWDSTQLLRPPGTINHKHGLPVLLAYSQDKRFSIPDFDFIPKVQEVLSEITEVKNLLPVESILSNYTLGFKLSKMIKIETPVEPYRSSFLARLSNELAEEGMNHTEIVSILHHVDLRIKKYTERHDQLLRLSQIADYALHKVLVEEELLVLSFEDILTKVDNLKWILPQWLHTTGFMILSGPPAVGKTQLATQLIYELETGGKFLNIEIPEKHRVMFLTLEMDFSAFKYILEHHKKEWEHPVAPMVIDETTTLNRYEDEIARREPTVLVVDSLSELLEVDGDGPNSETVRILRWIKKVKRRYGLAVILLHHNRKATEGNKKPKGLADLAYAYQLGQKADTVVQLWEDAKGIEFSTVKCRYGTKQAFMVARNENLWFRRIDDSGKPRAVRSDQKGDVGKPDTSPGHGNRMGNIPTFGFGDSN